jgi:hypothetical protein
VGSRGLRQQIRWPDSKGVGQEADVVQADVAFAAFNAADIGAVQPCFVRERFLTPPARLPQLPYLGPESRPSRGLLRAGGHASETCDMMTARPRTMSSAVSTKRKVSDLKRGTCGRPVSGGRAAAGLLGGALLALTLGACGTSSTGVSSAVTTAPPPAASSAESTAHASAPAHTLTFYALQFTALDKSCAAAADRIHDLSDNAPSSQTSQVFAAYAEACQTRDYALLRAQWPANVLVDIKAYVRDDGPLLTDAGLIGEGDASGLTNISSDIGAATAGENIVRADLDLPPDNS